MVDDGKAASAKRRGARAAPAKQAPVLGSRSRAAAWHRQRRAALQSKTAASARGWCARRAGEPGTPRASERKKRALVSHLPVKQVVAGRPRRARGGRVLLQVLQLLSEGGGRGGGGGEGESRRGQQRERQRERRGQHHHVHRVRASASSRKHALTSACVPHARRGREGWAGRGGAPRRKPWSQRGTSVRSRTAVAHPRAGRRGVQHAPWRCVWRPLVQGEKRGGRMRR